MFDFITATTLERPPVTTTYPCTLCRQQVAFNADCTDVVTYRDGVPVPGGGLCPTTTGEITGHIYRTH